MGVYKTKLIHVIVWDIGIVCWCNEKCFFRWPVWCRRTDELVDGPNASHITPSALDRWEARLEDLFAGRPYDMFDAALSDTVSRFPVDIQVCIISILHRKHTSLSFYSSFLAYFHIFVVESYLSCPCQLRESLCN